VNRLSPILLTFAGIVILGLLCNATLISAANTANSIAMASMASAFATSQCVTGVMVVVALLGGISLGANVPAIVGRFQQALPKRQEPYILDEPRSQYMLPASSDERLSLPDARAAESDDDLFTGWFG
jgi:hypothetical protein